MGLRHSKKVHSIQYYKNNYHREFSGNIRNIKWYFLYKGLKNNKINLTASLMTNRLIYKN